MDSATDGEDEWSWRELVWFVVVTVALHGAVVVLLNAGLALVERYGWFSEAKIQKKAARIPQPDVWRCMRHIAFIHLVWQPAGLPLFYAAMKWRGMAFTGPSPGWLRFCLELIAFSLVEDTCFYWIHRLFHTPFLYKRFHKFHHQFYQPYGLAAEYFHPVEFSFANAVPLFLGPLLLKSHVKTFWVWLCLRLAEGVDGHCGYDFWFVPFRYFPFRPGAGVHDFHHSHNTGNYGSLYNIWDRICGTDSSYVSYKQHQDTAGDGNTNKCS